MSPAAEMLQRHRDAKRQHRAHLHSVAAQLCRCDRQLIDTEADGDQRCVKCGRRTGKVVVV